MLNQLKTDLQTNPRLRLWLALIAGSMGIFGILTLRDELQNAEQQQRLAARAVSRLQGQLAQTEWLKRLPAAQAQAVQLESRLWQAPTGGLAQAALQDWLNTALAQTKATRPQITVTVLDEIVTGTETPNTVLPTPAAADGTAATPPDLWKIKAKVGFDFNSTSLLEFLRSLENHDKQIVIDSLTVRKEPLSHVELELLAYFQKQTPTDKPAAAAAASQAAQP
jgi:hypothetical protein